jgi:ATP-dependent DNA helicase RecQ
LAEIHSILKQYWEYDSFRPLQEEIITSVLNREDTLALLPTGGGKSICFQVPALAQPGLCLVISPLIALMKDQVENLRKKSITSFAIYSGMSRKEVLQILEVASQSNCKFLYVSPERLETKLFKEWLPALDISLIAVDEAHCISQWGYDFRPPYLRIAALREELSGIPVLAVTASATAEVQKDICERLNFSKPNIFRQSFERPNLSYSVFRVDSNINKILDILNKVNGSSIVYCRSRKKTRQISDLLNMNGVVADFYHAGLQQEERNTKQEAWIHNKIRTIVCTNAFGMGIDKPDVRVVIHADVPDCLENYYQEAGRAGRDGKKSYAVLLYGEKDIEELKQLPSIRYPSIKEIRKVYQSLMNHLQIPAGSGEGIYYDFDISRFIKTFQLDGQLVLASLKALEQEELMTFNEQVFVPSKIIFTVNKHGLFDFESSNQKLEPLIKTLLRTYEGIFDQSVSINEKLVAGILKQNVKQVINDLQELHRYGIIEYEAQIDSPQLYLMRNRIAAADLTIDEIAYNKRKKQFEKRIQKMIEYVGADTCRSSLIANYFGDASIKPCGICDNCLNQKRKSLTKIEFSSIHKKILQIVDTNTIVTAQLLEHMKPVNKHAVYEVLEFLQAENKIRIDERGRISVV